MEKDYKALTVVAVVESLSFHNVELTRIRTHCLENKVHFTTRLYNPSTKSDDRNFVEKLPALHVYYKKNYMRTFYVGFKSLRHVDECIEYHDRKLEKKKKRISLMSSLYTTSKKILYNLLHKKTRMERYNEEIKQWS